MHSAFDSEARKDEPSFWTVLVATALFICIVVVPPARAEDAETGFTQATFIRTQSIDVTVMSLDTSRFLQGIPLALTSSERAFRQIRPGVDYKKGMVWLTFKYNGRGGVISQIRNFKIKRSYPSTLRLTSGRNRSAITVPNKSPGEYLYPHAAPQAASRVAPHVATRAQAFHMPPPVVTSSLFAAGPAEIDFWNPAA